MKVQFPAPTIETGTTKFSDVVLITPLYLCNDPLLHRCKR